MKKWVIGVLVSLLIIVFVILLLKADLSTSSERARDFCRENNMELKGFTESRGGMSIEGECVKIIDGEIIDSKVIVYVQGLRDWVFVVRDMKASSPGDEK